MLLKCFYGTLGVVWAVGAGIGAIERIEDVLEEAEQASDH